MPNPRLNYVRDLNILFNFAVLRGWTAENPAADIEKPSLPDSDVCILTPEQVSALLLKSPAGILPGPILWGLAVGGEAGVRYVLEMLRQEFDLAIALSGCPRLTAITRDLVRSP